MKVNKSFIGSTELNNSFNTGIESIQQANSTLPTVSSKDKRGSKLSQKVEALIPVALQNVANFENHLPRNFAVDRIPNNHETIKSNRSKVAALGLEIKRLEDVNIVLGIEISHDFRIIHQAGVKTIKDDASFSAIVADLGSPFKKKSKASAQKANKKTAPVEKVVH